MQQSAAYESEWRRGRDSIGKAALALVRCNIKSSMTTALSKWQGDGRGQSEQARVWGRAPAGSRWDH
ncbi:hypothetical protein SBBP2_1790004 [Burkholderiales bacterium]|nr:hypothetical protein SBBP2_1790004 [Burkholderiales bacterium]